MSSGTGDILRGLVDSVADDVARAASEFGDDAVRSIMKLNPEMRKRLAALAERQMGVAVKQSPKYAANKSTADTTRKVSKSISDLFSNVQQTGNVGALPREIANARKLGELAGLSDTAGARETLANMVLQGSHRKPFEPISELDVMSNLEATKKGSLELLSGIQEDVVGLDQTSPYVLGRLGPAKDFVDEASKNYSDAVLGVIQGKIPNRFTEANSRLNSLANVFSSNDVRKIGVLGPSDVVPALNQLRLQALLRMIGDAQ